MGRRVTVEVYTRDGCHLCEVAEARAAQEAEGADLRLIDVDADPDLSDRYGVRVPVVLVDGQEIAHYELAPGEVRAAVRRALGRRPS